mmetsp:Transcript_7678/g.12926  ORF Transcript_7678/g.12926 Transcript_7678/m.12926 type:complete len:149 (-) Transcript_7678:53-499(-)
MLLRYGTPLLRSANGTLTISPSTVGSFGKLSTAARKRPDAISLTENAASRIKELLSEKDDAVAVKIGVKRRGCNGYSYTMNYADKAYMEATKDEKVSNHGVHVLVDPKAIFFLVGTVMDYVETPLSTEFTFTNPNSKGSCGCGESFNV